MDIIELRRPEQLREEVIKNKLLKISNISVPFLDLHTITESIDREFCRVPWLSNDILMQKNLNVIMEQKFYEKNFIQTQI